MYNIIIGKLIHSDKFDHESNYDKLKTRFLGLTLSKLLVLSRLLIKKKSYNMYICKLNKKITILNILINKPKEFHLINANIYINKFKNN